MCGRGVVHQARGEEVVKNSHNKGECWNPDKGVFVKNLFLPTIGNLLRVLLRHEPK